MSERLEKMDKTEASKKNEKPWKGSVNLPFYHEFRTNVCGNCGWEFIILAIARSKESPETYGDYMHYMELCSPNVFCPLCGEKVGGTRGGDK